MGRESRKTYSKSLKGKEAHRRYRDSVPGIDTRIKYLQRKRDKKMIIDALLKGDYNVQDMYQAIRSEFPAYTEKVILDLMRQYPSRRRQEDSVEEFEESRGIVIPVTGSFPEYYGEEHDF